MALVCGGTRTTFGQLDRAANAVAHALAGGGVGAGDRVAVMLGNRPEIFAAWYGVARLGALVVPVSTRLTAPEAAYIVADSGAAVVVHDGSAPALAAAESTGTAGLAVDDPRLAAGSEDPPDRAYLGNPVTTMSYTSGTTGRPKGISRPAPQPAAEAPPNPFAQFWGLRPDDVHLMCGPGYHMAPSRLRPDVAQRGGHAW